MHIRTQIRNYIVNLLDGNTAAGANVFPSRIYPLQNDNLPGICVYTPNEAIDDEEGKIARIQHRNQSIVIECREKINTDMDEALDDLTEDVEQIIFADRFLGGLLCAMDLLETETEISDDAEKPVGIASMTFAAQAMTDEGAPQTPI